MNAKGAMMKTLHWLVRFFSRAWKSLLSAWDCLVLYHKRIEINDALRSGSWERFYNLRIDEHKLPRRTEERTQNGRS